MEVKYLTCFILVYLVLTVICYDTSQSASQQQKDDPTNLNIDDDGEHIKQPIELQKHETNEPKDYFLPNVFNHHGETEEDDDEDDLSSYVDYEYDPKESNYKDSQDTATEKTSHIDDKIPVHSAKDNLPIFLLEPENTYVVKSKPATLKCRAANALEIYFKCNGDKIPVENFEFVDPQTGVRIIEGEHNVTRENVEEYFGTDKYQCFCFAWTSRGHIRSQSAAVELAYIKKHFTQTPQSQLAKHHTSVTFRCEPPPAAPFAQLYWLKNGAPLVVSDNVQISVDTFVIKQASLLDMANYTCVAENLAGKRLSEPALLTVFVNGGWSPWSNWTPCSCGSRSVGRHRTRSCTAPRPLNGGQPCLGPADQKTHDCMDCDIDMYVDGIDQLADESSDILLGHWSQWSEWSRCDIDCIQTRRRKCLLSGACHGPEYQVAQCPLCVRTSKTDAVRDGSSYWSLLIALSIAFLIFIVVGLLTIKYMKIKMAESSHYVKPSPGVNYFGNVLKRTLTNQPDLTIHEEFHTVDTRRSQNAMMSSVNNKINEHLYEVPQLSNSYMSPIDQEIKSNYAGSIREIERKENYIESERSDSSFMSSGSSYGHNSLEISPSLKNNTSLESKYMNHRSDCAISKILNQDGGWVNLDKCGVSLYVPDGAIDKGEELFSIEITDEDWNRPLLHEGDTQLSPVIHCGPKNLHFRKGTVLKFPQYAALKNSSWQFTILQKPDEINSREWRKVLTVGSETPGTPIFVQIDTSKVYIVSEFLSDFVIVGRSKNGTNSKLLKLTLFIAKTKENYYRLTAHVTNDTPSALNSILQIEKKNGSTIVSDPKTITFQENCSELCFNVKDVGIGWLMHSENKYQEIPYEKLWSLSEKSCCCHFVLQQIDSINCLELNMNVYQKQKMSNSVNLNVKSNDLNSNFSFNKRLSSVSVDTNYTINVFDNPLIFSSLSRTEGCYDFVYKNSNSIRKGNYKLDNYRTSNNVLTKSDRVILCKLLDPQITNGNDWRLLAEKLRLSSYYYYFSNTCSPTENILNLWLCRNNEVNMLLNLSRIFRDMSRIDCATVVERRCFTN